MKSIKPYILVSAILFVLSIGIFVADCLNSGTNVFEHNDHPRGTLWVLGCTVYVLLTMVFSTGLFVYAKVISKQGRVAERWAAVYIAVVNLYMSSDIAYYVLKRLFNGPTTR